MTVGILHIWFLSCNFIGLGGIAGIYMLHFVIAITFLGVLISILETVLVRLCIKASLTLKAMEKYLQNQDNSDDSNVSLRISVIHLKLKMCFILYDLVSGLSVR